MSAESRKFLLLDASVVVPYYLPKAARHKKVPGRISTLVDSVRKGLSAHLFLYVPNTCIGEVFDVFNRFCWASWNPQVRKVFPRGLHGRTYERVRREFREDIHNGRVLHQYELCRYHLLALDLISPVDQYFQHYRDRGKTKTKRPMGIADLLVAAMAIWLVRIHGWEQFALVTADHRMSDILTKVATRVASRSATAQKLGLPTRAAELGFQFDSHLYPRVLNLAQARNSDLSHFFGEWPLPTTCKPGPRPRSAAAART